VIIYHVLRDRIPYRDLGSNFFDEPTNCATRSLKRLLLTSWR
jgi:hypothetical protein